MTRDEHRLKRTIAVLVVALLLAGGIILASAHRHSVNKNGPSTLGAQTSTTPAPANSTLATLAKLPVKGRAPKTGYTRAAFAKDWEEVGGCDMREHILGRDLTNVQYRSASDCTVLSGVLHDPYTGKDIQFVRGPGTSTKVQIDHVVALGDAWQTGAQQLAPTTRAQLYNDPLELLAVDGPANQQKSDGDAATWLPPNKAYRCQYIARQIAVKVKYALWVTPAEHDAMQRILNTCPTQALPSVS